MRTGWLLYPEGWYYADGSGAQAIGWRYIMVYGTILMEMNGISRTDGGQLCKEYQGNNFYFAAGGQCESGWLLYPEGWYYADGVEHRQSDGETSRVLGII